MKTCRLIANRYRCISIALLLSSGSLLQILPALADQNSPTPGTAIENQATASFTDTADGLTGTIVSDKVSVAVAEVAGISAAASGVSGTAYRTSTVFVDFLVKNEGNDPTQLFIPATPSAATINGTAIPAANIGQLQVIEYNNLTTTTTISTNNGVNTTTGSTTGSLTGVPNNGSVPAGGFIKVRVPVTVPFGANVGDTISITLGNTLNQPFAPTNIPFVVGANGTGTNDLYTQDNTGTANGDFAGNPVNGDTTSRRQEASAVQTVTVVAPPTVSIKGTVFADADGSGTTTFTGIKTNAEIGANISPAINAILVDSTDKVLATTPVATDGTYTLTTPAAQNGLYVILSTSTGTVGSVAPAPGLPPTFAGTTPLTYVAVPFSVATTDVIGKDFGVDRLPVTVAVSAATQANPPGTTRYQVPTFSANDGEDGALGSGNTFRIVTLPNSTTQGTLFYNGVSVTAGQTITNYNPTLLTFDPIDGNVSMSFTYAAVDAAGKADPNPATASMTFSAGAGISGTVFNDKDNSANGTFTNIQTGAETGTNAVYGTTTVPDNAILVDATTGNVLFSTVVSSTGAYSFANVPANTNVRVLLSPTAGTIGAAPPAASAPIGWVATSPQDTGIFNTGVLPIVKDFGIRQKAKFVMVKRVTKINGATTNPNDGTVLSGATADNFNNVGNWPANYLRGSVSAGVVQPGDTIEYTVYFLNNQGADATSVKICDPIVGAQTYNAGSIQLQLGAATTGTPLTDSIDGNDRANFYAAGSAPIDCNAGAVPGNTAGVAIGITGATATANQPALPGVPGATAVATPAESYGLFRFTTKVKP